MSIFLVDEYKDMEPYVPGEQPKDKPYIKLNANETSMPPSPKVFEAVSKSEIWNMSYYADPHCHDFRRAVAEVYGVTEDEVFVGNGADEVLSFVLMSFFRRGMKIYFPDITYGFYRTYAKTYGLDMEEIPVKDDFSIDIDDYMDLDGDIIFANPNNPTGHSITLSEMKKISEAFKDIPVIFDEAYMEFGKESAVCLLKEHPNVFVCRTLSKAYGLAGIRCGFMISSQVEKLSALFIPYALSSVTQTIASVVLRHADEYKDTIATIISERERMYQEVKEFKQLTMYPSNANFLFGRSEKKDLLLAMFKEKNITIRNYEDASFRITIGTKEENEMVLDILRRFEYANS